MGSCAGRLRASRARYAAEFRAAARGPAGRRAGPGARAHSRFGRSGQARRFSRRSREPRTSAGLQHGHRPRARRWSGREDRLQGRAERQRGRPARRDRSPAVPGRARSGEGEEDAGRGQSRQCAAGPAALLDARQAELRHPAATRHPGRARQSADRPDRGGRGRDRRRAGPARLHQNPRPDLRARRVPSRRRGQHGGRVPADRHRRDRADPADRRHLHRAGGRRRPHQCDSRAPASPRSR